MIVKVLKNIINLLKPTAVVKKCRGSFKGRDLRDGSISFFENYRLAVI